MSGPVHYDTDAMRQAFINASEEQLQLAMARTRNEKDRLYVQAQRQMAPAVAELMCNCAEAQNAGVPDAMVIRSAGLSLGRMASSLVATFGIEIVAEIVDGFTTGINIGLTRGAQGPDGLVIGETCFAPMQGGHA